jgi:hypothetical protein
VQVREIYIVKSPLYMGSYIRETEYIYKPARVMNNINAYGEVLYCVDIIDNMGIRKIYAFPNLRIAKHFTELILLKSIGGITALKLAQSAYDRACNEATSDNFENMLDLCLHEQMTELVNKGK